MFHVKIEVIFPNIFPKHLERMPETPVNGSSSTKTHQIYSEELTDRLSLKKALYTI